MDKLNTFLLVRIRFNRLGMKGVTKQNKTSNKHFSFAIKLNVSVIVSRKNKKKINQKMNKKKPQ